MALLTESVIRATAQSTAARLQKSHRTVLSEAAETEADSFDIFLSHSIKDAEIVSGARSVLIGLGYSVYVDWIVDSEMDRGYVSSDTAAILKWRMRQCSTLLYLATENSGGSKWMPWELGFFDGYSTGRVAIFPVTKDQRPHFGV
jgi:hypothetical protein